MENYQWVEMFCFTLLALYLTLVELYLFCVFEMFLFLERVFCLDIFVLLGTLQIRSQIKPVGRDV